MIKLFLDPDLPYESLFDFAAAQRWLLNFLNSNLNACGLVTSKLYLSIGSLSQISFFGLNELKIVFFNIWQKLLKTLLFRG